MTIAEDTLYRIMMSSPVTMDAADDGIIMVLLLMAAAIIILKPNFSRL